MKAKQITADLVAGSCCPLTLSLFLSRLSIPPTIWSLTGYLPIAPIGRSWQSPSTRCKSKILLTSTDGRINFIVRASPRLSFVCTSAVSYEDSDKSDFQDRLRYWLQPGHLPWDLTTICCVLHGWKGPMVEKSPNEAWLTTVLTSSTFAWDAFEAGGMDQRWNLLRGSKCHWEGCWSMIWYQLLSSLEINRPSNTFIKGSPVEARMRPCAGPMSRIWA